MYQANDVVQYGVDGVCRISGTTERNVRGQRIEYYVLQSLNQHATVYVPVQNEQLVSRMRRLLTGNETMELIHSMPDEQTIWIDDDNQRQSAYEAILAGDDRSAVVRVIKTLYERKQQMSALKRKMHAADERLLHEAERRLYDEFAHALKIDVDDVIPFIFSQIGTDSPVPEGRLA